jgi:hypothetical protein
MMVKYSLDVPMNYSQSVHESQTLDRAQDLG